MMGPPAGSLRRKMKRSSPGSQAESYTYTVCPGNNSRILLGMFRARPWFFSHKSTSGDPSTVWEMYRNPARYISPTSRTPSKKASPTKRPPVTPPQASRVVLNHFEKDGELVTKHGLYWNMRALYEKREQPYPEFFPESYHLTPGDKSQEWSRFEEAFRVHASRAVAQISSHTASEQPRLPPINSRSSTELGGACTAAKKKKKSEKTGDKEVAKNVWICKPAALSNRGMGIKVVSSLDQVRSMIDNPKCKKTGYIVQKYIERPLLIHTRKFDIRVFLLLVADPRNGDLLAYVHQDGYIRTSSFAYSLSSKSLKNNFVHLTNDGIQKKDGSGYGKVGQE